MKAWFKAVGEPIEEPTDELAWEETYEDAVRQGEQLIDRHEWKWFEVVKRYFPDDLGA